MRYPSDIRWTGRLQSLLGDDYRVIEEGCNGRTTVFEDPIEGWKAGLGYLRPCLNSHKPVDIVIMMLGSNDLKEYFHASAEEIAAGAGTLVKEIIDFTGEKQGFVPKIILVSPPEIGEGIVNSPFYGHFYENAIDRSREFPKWYKKVADEYGCIFFDAAKYITPSPVDSLHLSPEAHGKLAEEFSKVIKEL
jgi:Lysophospholipase L1 and related esterases